MSVSMHPPDSADLRIGNLPHADIQLREHGLRSLLLDAIAEFATHPVHAIRTLLLAARDSLGPGEKTSLAGRAKNLVHAITGLAAARRLRPIRIAHIHCHFAHAPAGVGMYAAEQLGIEFSFVGHANDLFANRLLLRRKLERAAFVSCISEWHRDWYRVQAANLATPLPIIRCGVRVDPASGGEEPDVLDAPLRLISVARLVPKKGLDQLIRALAIASQVHDLDWMLRVAGDGPEREPLESLARRDGVADRVSFLGAVSPDQVESLLREADVFVLPCRVDGSGDRDGIPVALMEAMSAGVPVIAGDLPTLRELIIHGETGILCDVEDLDGLAKTIVDLAADTDRRRLLRAGARRHVVQEFGLEQNARRLDVALRQVHGVSNEHESVSPSRV